MEPVLADDKVAAFARDGVVCLRSGAFDIRTFGLQPGDAIFFDFLIVHGAPGFLHPGRRRILSLRYLSADARHAPRTWRTSPPFDDLGASLPAGAAMDHPLFPVVWPT
jgi:ectoine hydroxylase-related dioxygenase (phytanoyl-CoA dioxygenase family)